MRHHYGGVSWLGLFHFPKGSRLGLTHDTLVRVHEGHSGGDVFDQGIIGPFRDSCEQNGKSDLKPPKDSSDVLNRMAKQSQSDCRLDI
jgi:hypothetical protein